MNLGRYKIGFAPLSMGIVFVVSSILAILSALSESKPEYPMPFSSLIMIKESLALMITLIYGILIHWGMSLVKWYKSR